MNQTKHLKGGCQHCGGHIEFPAEAIGTVADCPHCGKPTELMLEVPRSEPTVPRRTIIWTSIAVLILVGGFAGAVIALKRAQARVEARHAAAADQAMNAAQAGRVASNAQSVSLTGGFKASSVSLVKTPGSSLVYAVGKVTNPSQQQRFGVRVELELLDAAGAKVGTAKDYQQVIEPGASWEFKALVVDSKKAASARVAAISEDK